MTIEAITASSKDGLEEIVNATGDSSSNALGNLLSYPIRGVQETAQFLDKYVSTRFGLYQAAGGLGGLLAKSMLPLNDVFSDGSYTDAGLMMLTTTAAITVAQLGAYMIGERIKDSKSFLTSASELWSIRKVEMALTVPLSIALSALQINLIDTKVGMLAASMSTYAGLHTIYNFAVGLGINREYRQKEELGLDPHMRWKDAKNILIDTPKALGHAISSGIRVIGNSINNGMRAIGESYSSGEVVRNVNKYAIIYANLIR